MEDIDDYYDPPEKESPAKRTVLFWQLLSVIIVGTICEAFSPGWWWIAVMISAWCIPAFIAAGM